MIKFFLSEIADRFVRENFQKIDSYFRDEPFRKGRFKFIEKDLVADDAEVLAGYPVTRTFRHELGFQPKDIIQLSATGGATIVWDYIQFTRTHLSLTFSADCTVRFYVGRHEESA